MRKKKPRSGELEAPTAAPAADAPAPGRAARRKGRTTKATTPLDLARAIAAARAIEAAQVTPPTVAPPHVAPATAATGQSAPGPVALEPVAPGPGARAPVAPTMTAARSLRDRVRARVGTLEMLVFRVGRERFGIELAAVEEAIDIPPVHHVPEMPQSMLGVITVRGTLTSVYSPTLALGLAIEDGTSALIFRRGRARIAIVVDEVDDVSTLDLATLRDSPALDTGDGLLLGVVRRNESLLALVDADALLAACQAAPLLEIA